MGCGVGLRRGGLDLAVLWLWCRQAATAPIGPLAWEPPYATGAALKKKDLALDILTLSQLLNTQVKVSSKESE